MALPGHMTALGFAVTTEQDFRHYVYQATEFGEKRKTPNGSYTLWSIGSGIELWVQTNLHHRLIGMNPHFHGESLLRVDLTRRLPRASSNILDGAFYAWAPAYRHTLIKQVPFVFDLPNYDEYDELDLPCSMDIQLAAFAQHLQAFATPDIFLASKMANEQKFRLGSLFMPGHQSFRQQPQAIASFSASIQATRMLTNPVTGQKFYWARVEQLGGTLDVVADPQVVQGVLVPQGILSGTFWLSGHPLS